MALTIPVQFKGVSALLLTFAGLFIAIAPTLQGSYPVYSGFIAFLILMAREYVKDYGTPDTDTSALQAQITALQANNPPTDAPDPAESTGDSA